MKDHRISPHGDGDGIVSERQTERADKKSLRLGEEPDSAHAQEVDEITEISQEVMITPFLVCIPSNGHEVKELHGVPDMEILRISSDQVSTDEHIQDSTNEGYLFSSCDCLGIVPTPANSVDTLPHTFPISFELFVRGWNAPSPFLDDSFFRM